MTKTLFEKMFLKPDYKIAVLNSPKELEPELQIQKTDDSLIGTYNFILAFYTKKEDIEKQVSKFKTALVPNGLLWIAYPKNKAMATDLNRDILHELMKHFGFDGVSLVSISTTWSAMRFKSLLV